MPRRLFGEIKAPAFPSLNIGILAALGVGVLAYKIVGRFQMKSKPIRYNPKVVVRLMLVIFLLASAAVPILTVMLSAKTAMAGTSNAMVAAGYDHTVGLKTDGTVVATGWTDDGQCDVTGWSGIEQVAAGVLHTVGLKTGRHGGGYLG